MRCGVRPATGRASRDLRGSAPAPADPRPRRATPWNSRRGAGLGGTRDWTPENGIGYQTIVQKLMSVKPRNRARLGCVFRDRRGSYENETTRHLVARGKLTVRENPLFFFRRGWTGFWLWILRARAGGGLCSAAAAGSLRGACLSASGLRLGCRLLGASRTAVGVAGGILGAQAVSARVLGRSALLPRPVVSRALAVEI